MNILNYRVDDRLVHGCVATMWVPKLNVQRILCIDDESANNPMLKSALRMATPNEVYLSVLTHEKAIENLKNDRYGNQAVMIVSKNPKTYLELVKNDIAVPLLTLGNLGNLEKSENSVVISRYITVNDDDAKVLEELDAFGVEMEAKLQPADDEIKNFYKYMKSKRGK